MNRTIFVLVAAAVAVQAQEQTGPQRYLTTQSLHVPADKVAAYIEHARNGAGAKAAKASLAAVPQMQRITVLQAVFPGDPAPRANFIRSVVNVGAPGEPDVAKRDETYRASTGMSYADYLKMVRTMSEVVGTTISHVHDTTDGYTLAAGDYIVRRRLKVAEGKTQDLNNLMRNTRLKLTNDRVKEGNIKGWSFSHLSFPTGSALPWDATEVFVHKDLASAMAGPGQGGGPAAGRYLKLFPNGNYARFIEDARETSKIVRTDLYRVIAAFVK